MAKSVAIELNILNLNCVQDFLTAMQEIAGTTNDPNTAANIRAAIEELQSKVVTSG
ncbi:MAG: hypothetical protein ACREHG_02060 [Candidatus Saccharimonadales bacterium]